MARHPNPKPTRAQLQANARSVHPMFDVEIELTGEEIEKLRDEVFGITRTQNDERIAFEEHQDKYKSESKERDGALRDRLKTLKNGFKIETLADVYEVYNNITDVVEYWFWEEHGGNRLIKSRPAEEHERQATLSHDAEE